MGHTNSTTNYSLPQFITTDKPAWLTDVNNAFLAIDTGMNNAQTAANNAQGDATTALGNASAASTAAATADAKGAGAVASLADAFDPAAIYDVGDLVMYNNLLYICSAAVTTPGPWTGVLNWTRVSVEDMINSVKADIVSGTTYQINDIIALRYKTIAGTVTGTPNVIQFFIPTAKMIDASVGNATISGSSFRVYPSGTSSEQVAITDGSWSFNVRTDGVYCSFTLTDPIPPTGAVTIYFSSSTNLTLLA